MSELTDADSPEAPSRRSLSHRAFCALVDLALARQDGTATTPWAENLFLTRWLTTAQRRFPWCVATDIALLLERGRSQGPAAGLRQKFDYLWRSCSGIITAQSDLFRLTYATEVLKDDVWGSRVVSTNAWLTGEVPDVAQENGFWVEKEALNTAFTGDGTLLSSVPFGRKVISHRLSARWRTTACRPVPPTAHHCITPSR
ncbi:DUF2913 family protein [Enterobacteriaceae bacterium C34A]